MKANQLLTAILFSTAVSFAQTGDNQSVAIPQTTVPQKQFTVLLDGTSVLLSGAGVKASTGLANNLTLGVLAQKYKMKSDENDLASAYSYTHEITNIGIIADYFFSKTATESGPYASAAIVFSKLKTKVDGSLFGAKTAEDSATGFQAKVGYQIVSNLTPSSDVVAQLGLGYGSAGAVSWKLGGSETKLKSAVLLDLSLGVKF